MEPACEGKQGLFLLVDDLDAHGAVEEEKDGGVWGSSHPCPDVSSGCEKPQAPTTGDDRGGSGSGLARGGEEPWR